MQRVTTLPARTALGANVVENTTKAPQGQPGSSQRTFEIGTPRLRTTWQIEKIVITLRQLIVLYITAKEVGKENVTVSGNVSLSATIEINKIIVARTFVTINVSHFFKALTEEKARQFAEVVSNPVVLSILEPITVPPGMTLEVTLTLTPSLSVASTTNTINAIATVNKGINEGEVIEGVFNLANLPIESGVVTDYTPVFHRSHHAP